MKSTIYGNSRMQVITLKLSLFIKIHALLFHPYNTNFKIQMKIDFLKLRKFTFWLLSRDKLQNLSLKFGEFSFYFGIFFSSISTDKKNTQTLNH
jgi:hypothetical protein